jgi:hypothetical protein
MLNPIDLGLQQNNAGMNTGSVGIDPYAAASEEHVHLRNDDRHGLF